MKRFSLHSNRKLAASASAHDSSGGFFRKALGATILLAAGLYSTVAIPAEQLPASEFESLKEARELQRQLRTISDKVAPAVVALTYHDIANDYTNHEGSGVVINASGLILTHGHHGRPQGTVLQARFPDGRVVDAEIQSVYFAQSRDFSLLRIQQKGPFPDVPIRRDKPLAAGERCFHFGYPGSLRVLNAPLLRLGRIAGNGEFSTYANCLIVSGDSGGPLFDFEGRVIGILDLSIGPMLAHPGIWANISKILDGATFLATFENTETIRLGFLDQNRKAVDTQRHVANDLLSDVLAKARQATVEVLIDGSPTVLGTVVDADGIVVTKRSEILTHRGALLGELACRLFNGEKLSANVVADSHGDDLVLLQIPKTGLTPAPWSPQEKPVRGAIVIVPVPGKDVSETGVMSVDCSFPIKADAGHVQLNVEMREAGATVTGSNSNRELERFRKIIRGSIDVGDVITRVDGKECPDLAAYEAQTQSETFIGGDFIMFSVRRNGVTSQVALPIEAEPSADSITSREYADTSLRLTGFPEVVSHDTIVARQHCGGPVVDLEGRVVGVNIARFHRFSTLAIPQTTIQRLVREMVRTSL